MADQPHLSVQALTKYIKRKFEADPYLRSVFVKGELSNVKIHPSGHIYFTLKDDQSRIQAAMFRSSAGTLKFKPENGMNVLITGDVSVYESSGQYQLYVQTMQPDGIGALYIAFEQLKEKLGKEGLFDARFKMPLPLYPEKIGVITAQSGAAVQDICTTISRRYPLADILIFPAIVQGPKAAPSIIQAIEQAQLYGGINVLIVGRGGGSIEDLWAFNEEEVARAIFSCKIPVISAVGHETDTTIADFTADFRAPTPTAAAEVAVPSRQDLMERILDRKRSLYRTFAKQIKTDQKRLTALQSSYPLQFPDRMYRPFAERLIGLEGRLSRSGNEQVSRQKNNMLRLSGILTSYSPDKRIKEEKRIVAGWTDRLTRSSFQQIRSKQEAFQSSLRMMQALNPLAVMERGFSITYADDKVVKSIQQLTTDESIRIRLQDGTAEAKVLSIHMEGDE